MAKTQQLRPFFRGIPLAVGNLPRRVPASQRVPDWALWDAEKGENWYPAPPVEEPPLPPKPRRVSKGDVRRLIESLGGDPGLGEDGLRIPEGGYLRHIRESYPGRSFDREFARRVIREKNGGSVKRGPRGPRRKPSR
jgi:hypothetical protein